MPLPNVSSQPNLTPVRGEVTRENLPANFRDFPGYGNTSPATSDQLIQNRVFNNPSNIQLQRELEEIIGEGGVGLSPEQLDVQFRGIEQQLQPQFNTQLQRIDEQASRRGVFRSGIPLAQSQKTQRQQAQQLGNIRTQLETDNERQKNQTLLTALNMLRELESDLANRELYLQALDELKKAQDQGAYIDLATEIGFRAVDLFYPGAGTAAQALTSPSRSSRPSGGF